MCRLKRSLLNKMSIFIIVIIAKALTQATVRVRIITLSKKVFTFLGTCFTIDS